MSGKGFNHSARDAWELFQSTGVEALIAYDCSGAVLLMGTVLGGLITGTCTGVWTWLKTSDRVIMVGSTTMLMGMILVSVFIKSYKLNATSDGDSCNNGWRLALTVFPVERKSFRTRCSLVKLNHLYLSFQVLFHLTRKDGINFKVWLLKTENFKLNHERLKI